MADQNPLVAVHSPYVAEKVTIAVNPPFVIDQTDLIVRLLREDGTTVAEWNGLNDGVRACRLAGMIRRVRAEVKEARGR